MNEERCPNCNVIFTWQTGEKHCPECGKTQHELQMILSHKKIMVFFSTIYSFLKI